jgi:hypothetical protein
MRLQDVGTATVLSAGGVVSKRDEDGEVRRGKLADRLHQLEFATSQGFTLAHTAVRCVRRSGEHYATFVDTLTQDRSL